MQETLKSRIAPGEGRITQIYTEDFTENHYHLKNYHIKKEEFLRVENSWFQKAISS